MNMSAIRNFAIRARVYLLEAAKGKMIDNNEIKDLSKVVEETAYKCFDRFIMMRFVKLNGYPADVISEFLDVSGDYLSDNLEEEFNALETMAASIPEEDWHDSVQIIGWLYQYYNSELKDETFALLKKNVKITKERIPAATQFFTPDWIVKYLVENSLGRLWYEGHHEYDKSVWKYYIDEAEQETEEPQIQESDKLSGVDYKPKKNVYSSSDFEPENIKVIDPCMGAGNILVYIFDVLMQIYKSAGWSESDAAKSIIKNNLYGLDIDDRVGRLAYFTVMMKAYKYDPHIFEKGLRPNIYAVTDSDWMSDEFMDYVAGDDADIKNDLVLLRNTFKDAKEYGCIINVPTIRYDVIYRRIEYLLNSFVDLEQDPTQDPIQDPAQDSTQAQNIKETLSQLYSLVKQAEIMAQKYDVVITNPPYMGISGMSNSLAAFVKKNYPDSRNDMSTVFMERCLGMCAENGYMAMINIPVWMFISGYEKLRRKLYRSATIINMVHPGRGVFGSDFGSTAFVMKNTPISGYRGTYRRLFGKQGEVKTNEAREEEFFSERGTYIAMQDNFEKIPGAPVAYWVSDNLIDVFINSKQLGSIADSKQGLATTDNNRFLRLWFETSYNRIGFWVDSTAEAADSNCKWFPYNKGGDFRKWYGNNDYIVNYENDGQEIKESVLGKYSYLKTPDYVVKNTDYYFRPSVSWSLVSSAATAFRYKETGFIFDVAGMSMFSGGDLMYLLALCNTKIVYEILNIIAPTINFQCGDIAKIPVIFPDQPTRERIEKIARQNVELSKQDWDSFETSWDFKRHPLVEKGPGKTPYLIADIYAEWQAECEARFNQLKANEEELNRIFIDIYRLQGELTPEVEDKYVTVRKADLRRDIKSLISYAVGCMFGRYSVDTDGLCYAGGEWDASKYKTVKPVEDNILLIGEGTSDDISSGDAITSRFVDFIRKAYGEETLEMNLKFIADALGGRGNPYDVIRRYFIKDFFADHCSTYSVKGSGKRPIYWLFDSGGDDGFKALIYMHRYQPKDLERMYEYFVKTDHNKTAEGQKYSEKLHHLAEQKIAIDLDDGVRENYAKFREVLAKIK